MQRIAVPRARANIQAMNKAFVREPDVEVPERLAELPVPPPPNLVTSWGLRQITASIEDLDRRLAMKAEAGLDPDEVARLQRDRRYWTARFATAQLTDAPPDPDEIGFGSEVTVAWPGRGEVTLRIVGEDEADPNHGLVGWRAPVATALAGNSTGDEVDIELAGRQIRLAVLAVRNARNVD